VAIWTQREEDLFKSLKLIYLILISNFSSNIWIGLHDILQPSWKLALDGVHVKLAKLSCFNSSLPCLNIRSSCDSIPSEGRRSRRIHPLPCLFYEDRSDTSSPTGHSFESIRSSEEMLDANQAVIGWAIIARVTDRNSSRSHCSNFKDGVLGGTPHTDTGIVWPVLPEIAPINVLVVMVAINDVDLWRIGKLYRSHSDWSVPMGGEVNDEFISHYIHITLLIILFTSHFFNEN